MTVYLIFRCLVWCLNTFILHVLVSFAEYPEVHVCCIFQGLTQASTQPFSGQSYATFPQIAM